jgi:hypothetical protein
MAHETKIIKVGKLDAALRQLRTAIRLWFYDGDPVAVHALASASHEIIHTLYRRMGLHDLIFDTDHIKDEFRSDWAKSIKKAPSFFKHAQNDPDGEIEFNTEVNEMLLFLLVNGLRRMGQSETLEEMAFSRWMMVHNVELVKEEARDLLPDALVAEMRKLGKRQYFDGFEAFWKQTKSKN